MGWGGDCHMSHRQHSMFVPCVWTRKRSVCNLAGRGTLPLLVGRGSLDFTGVESANCKRPDVAFAAGGRWLAAS